MKRCRDWLVLLLMCLPSVAAFGETVRPSFSADLPPATAPTDAQMKFQDQLNASLINHGISVFGGQDTTFPSLAKLKVYRPFTVGVGGPFGDFYGRSQLFLGFSSAPSGVEGEYPNLQLLNTLNYGNHVRFHSQSDLRRVPYSSIGARTLGITDVYGDFYSDGDLHTGSTSGAQYHAMFRVGRFGQLDYPYIDPLTLLDRVAGGGGLTGKFSYTGVMLAGELDSHSGAGVHGSVYKRIGTRGTLGTGFLNDLYAVYRRSLSPQPIFFEGRLGWIPQSFVNSPVNAVFGGQLYVGYQRPDYGLGGFVSPTAKKGTTVGVSVTLARNAISEVFGIGPTKFPRQPIGIAPEIPVANINWFASTAPVAGEAVMGQKAQIETWSNGEHIGVGSTDVVDAGLWGATTGKQLRRVVTVTPWWLYNDSYIKVPKLGGPRLKGGENQSRWRSDVEYTLYRILPMTTYRVVVAAQDAETHKPLKGAAIVATGPDGTAHNGTTGRSGDVSMRIRQAPDAAANFHVVGSLKDYQPASQDITLSPTGVSRVTLQFAPLRGTVSGTVLEDITNTPVPDAEVILVPGTGEPVIKTTDANGAYSIADIRPGPFTLRVHKPGYNDVSGPIVVAGGQTLTENFHVVAQRGGIVGQIVDAGGAPIANAAISIVNAAGATVVSRTSGSDGNFAERLDPGVYTVNVTSAGFAAGTATVTVAPGELARVTVTLQKAP